MENPIHEKSAKRKRIFACLSLLVVLIIIAFLTYFLGIRFMSIASDGVGFKDFIQSYGTYGIFVAVGIQIIQVFIALIPGEVVEVGIGFAYGWFWGSLVCLGGVTVGSALIFLLVKRFGIKILEYFMSTDKINDLRIINSEERLKRLTFLLYFIPGTPKDLLTYFFGLTRMTLKEFLTITIFARIPTVLSSTVGGNLIGSGHYFRAIALFVIIALLSFLGLKAYRTVIRKLKKKHESGTRFFSSEKLKRK